MVVAWNVAVFGVLIALGVNFNTVVGKWCPVWSVGMLWAVQRMLKPLSPTPMEALTRGDAWVLLPLEILGRPAARAVTLRAETREMRFGSSGAPKQFSTYPGITIRMPPRAAESYCDRIPDKGTIDLQAQ